MLAIILCGGSGTRLWPLSRKNYPKQFLNLIGENSLLQDTFLRIKKTIPIDKIFIVGNKDNFFNIFNQIKDVEKDYKKENILIEPASLNTTPGIALAIKYFIDKLNIDKNEQILILPSDHYIANVEEYNRLLNDIFSLNSNNIITIGIKPDRPEIGYGYIKTKIETSNLNRVLEFKEKPDFATAEKYFTSGEYLWNSGMYIFNSNTFLEEIRKYCLEIFSLMEKNYDEFINNFNTLPNISIDYAIAEKSDKVFVAFGDFGWNDIGSFDRLADISINNKNSINIESKKVFSYSSTNKLIVTLGVEDLNIIESNDSILVQKRGMGEDVKKVTEYLKEHNIKELDNNIIVHRPWGKYEVLMDELNYKVKKIIVYPGCKLSLQSHMHRSEHWVVVNGEASIVNGDKNLILLKNESSFIPQNTKHRLENPGKINLEIIEVQTGEYVGEDDIIRYDDIYGRE